MYSYQDVKKIAGVRTKVIKRILKRKKISDRNHFSDQEIRLIVKEVDKYEKYKSNLQMLLVIVLLIIFKLAM